MNTLIKLNKNNNTKALPLVVAITLSLFLGGCSLMHEEYVQPKLDNYAFENINHNAIVTENLVASLDEYFQDEHLSNIVKQALENNNDYFQAVIKSKKALVEADITTTNLIPEFSANIGNGVSRRIDVSEHSKKNSSSKLSLSYEVDIFGKLSAERNVANLAAHASVFDVKAAKLTLISNVASIYWQIVYLKDAVRLSEANFKDSKETLEIMENRYTNGDISELEFVQAKRDFLNTETSLAEYKTKLDNSISAMNVLLNKTPDSEVVTIESLRNVYVPTLRTGMSADLVKSRPDLASAELNLRSVLARKDVAKLSIYPTFSLNASISGGSSKDLYDFLNDPVGSLASMIAFPFLNYYQRSLDIDLAKLSYESEEMKFVTAYYKAVAEVHDSLNNIQLYNELLLKNEEKFLLSKKTEEIYLNQYENGKVALKDYLEAKATRRSQALNLASQKSELLNHVMTLGKALGGF